MTMKNFIAVAVANNTPIVRRAVPATIAGQPTQGETWIRFFLLLDMTTYDVLYLTWNVSRVAFK